MISLYLLLPYAIVASLAFFLQRRLMYFPAFDQNLSMSGRELDGIAIKDVQLQTFDHFTIHGWLLQEIKPASASTYNGESGAPPIYRSALLIYFSGNAGNRYDRLHDLQTFVTAGYDVLIFDYRGYGDSQGSPAEPAMESDAKQIYRFARELGYQESRIVLFGESLGGGVALSLWSDPNTFSPKPAAVILKSTFTSMSDVASFHYPWLPVRWLLVDRWPSLDRLKHVQSPVTIIHGTDDEIVPFPHAQVLRSSALISELIEHIGGTHNDMPIDLIREQLRKIRVAMEP